MTNGCCPPAFGTRSETRMTSSWCPRLLAPVWVASPTVKGTSSPLAGRERIISGYCVPAVSIRLGARMTSGWCPPDCRHSHWREDYERMVPRLLAPVLARWEQRSQVASAHRPSANATGCWYSFGRLATPRRGSSPPRREHESQATSARWLLAFVWEQG